jgi:hypothetical protein
MAPINLPDGTEVSEVILPDGASASAVIGPDGNTVFSTIPDGRVANIDASQLSLSDGDPVNTWPDTIGDFGDLQADASRTPVYDIDGMNGNSTVEMSEDFFTVTTATEITQPFYLFAVYNNDDAGTERFYFLHEDSGNEARMYETESNTVKLNVGGTEITGGTTDSNNHLVVFGAESGTGFIRFDGAEVQTGSIGTGSINGAYQVGNNGFDRYADGSVSQMEWFEGSLTSSEISNEESRIADKWGVTL